MGLMDVLAAVTQRADWELINGPDSGTGVDYWLVNGDGEEANVNDDQGFVSIAVNGETVWSGYAHDLDD